MVFASSTSGSCVPLCVPECRFLGYVVESYSARDSFETIEKVSREEHFQGRHSLWFIFYIMPRMETMKPHPTHKIETIIVVRSYEIAYCDYCGIFVTHPEIEQPCKRKPDLLAKLKRREAAETEYIMWKSAERSHIYQRLARLDSVKKTEAFR